MDVEILKNGNLKNGCGNFKPKGQPIAGKKGIKFKGLI